MAKTRGRPGLFLPAASLALLLLSACSFDYGSSGGEAAEELPSAVFRGFTHRVVDRGAKVLELRAAIAESYTESRRMLLRDVVFSEFDRGSGAIVTSGKAERAIIYTDSEDAEFSGGIEIDSAREEALLEAEYLAWDSAEKRITSRLDRSVVVRRRDGSWIRGAGFSADLRRRSFSFRESAEGFIDAEESPAPSSDSPVDAAGTPAPAASSAEAPNRSSGATP